MPIAAKITYILFQAASGRGELGLNLAVVFSFLLFTDNAVLCRVGQKRK